MTAPTALPATHREVHLTARPSGTPSEEHFTLVTAPVPVPGPGQVLIRTTVLGVPVVLSELVRGRDDLPMPPFDLGACVPGPSIGEVVDPGGSGLRVGDLVSTRTGGWREYAALGTDAVQRLDLDALPDPAAHLTQGAAAYLGVVRAGEVRAGDTVFVTSAAGAVGSLAGQIARLRGAGRVIGSTGSQRKADTLTKELGYDAAVLRGAGPVEEQLRAAAPDGVDVVIDQVAGDQLKAAVAVARSGARIALIGALAGQLGDTPTIDLDPVALITRSITLRGATLFDHLDIVPEWTEFFGRGLRDGTLTFPRTVLKGLDQAPRALRELIAGRHTGTVHVEL
ncbi:NADP-dependent oxidoreductase [Streptomyces albofaciens JCM 4342]|uniref:MDR family NADP-dependent oxidoreductase n=1 Tax=Streptomyces albofaciens TaxID=66866 RepID=UPI00123B2A9E|nr:NADP-dependent oxidoreductase [Streptomyces albofaciens]KAA6212124.1 NADP-dependent oxidoreductase [Streptomyces albofaciens JCM 4342]